MYPWLRAAVWAAAVTLSGAESEPMKLVDKPVTVTVSVPERAGRGGPLLLQLRQVIAPKSVAVRINIFVDLPAADAATSVDAANFAGYVTLLPNPSAPNHPPKGITLQVADSAARLIRDKRTAKITFVLSEKAAESSVTIGSIRLE